MSFLSRLNVLQLATATLYLALFTHAIYMLLTTYYGWHSVPAGATGAAGGLLFLFGFGSGLVANPTRFEAEISAYSSFQLFLWLSFVVLCGGYSWVLALHASLGLGIDPSPPAIACLVLGAWLGSYLFKRAFVPHTWGPFAKRLNHS